MHTYRDLLRFTEHMHEALRDAQLAERHGAFDLADELRAEADDAAWYIDQLRAAGVSEEFPGGEFAVIGVTAPCGPTF